MLSLSVPNNLAHQLRAKCPRPQKALASQHRPAVAGAPRFPLIPLEHEIRSPDPAGPGVAVLGAAEPERRTAGNPATMRRHSRSVRARMWLRHCDTAHRFRSSDVISVRSLQPHKALPAINIQPLVAAWRVTCQLSQPRRRFGPTTRPFWPAS